MTPNGVEQSNNTTYFHFVPSSTDDDVTVLTADELYLNKCNESDVAGDTVRFPVLPVFMLS